MAGRCLKRQAGPVAALGAGPGLQIMPAFLRAIRAPWCWRTRLVNWLKKLSARV